MFQSNPLLEVESRDVRRLIDESEFEELELPVTLTKEEEIQSLDSEVAKGGTSGEDLAWAETEKTWEGGGKEGDESSRQLVDVSLGEGKGEEVRPELVEEPPGLEGVEKEVLDVV